jgi:hypothetical protein
MEVTLSTETIELLSSKIAEKLADKLNQTKHENFVGIADLSKAINTPVGTIYHWVNNARQNKIPFAKKGVRLQFKISEVQRWMGSK